MNPIVVGFSGRQASGKTMLSTEIGARLGWLRVSFGDYVRVVASRRGIADESGNLQELGADLIRELGWEEFCRQVLLQVEWSPGQPLLVDGIRHVEALSTLERLVYPSALVHVHINVSDVERQARLAAREGEDIHPGAGRSEHHSTELQVLVSLPSIADLIVDGDRPFAESVQRVLDWIADQS